MTSYFLALLPLLALTTAIPTPASDAAAAAPTGWIKGTQLKFNASTPTGYGYLSADVSGAECYPHGYSNVYLGDDDSQVLNFVVTANQHANGRAPVAINVTASDCWDVLVNQGVMVTAAPADPSHHEFYIEGVELKSDKAPHGFYYCGETTGGKGWIAKEDKSLSHAGAIYDECFDITIEAYFAAIAG